MGSITLVLSQARAPAGALAYFTGKTRFAWTASRSQNVTLAYSDFEDFWQAQTPGYAPTTKIIDAMTEGERRRLKRAVQEALSIGPNGKIEYSARANAIRAAVPKAG